MSSGDENIAKPTSKIALLFMKMVHQVNLFSNINVLIPNLVQKTRVPVIKLLSIAKPRTFDRKMVMGRATTGNEQSSSSHT